MYPRVASILVDDEHVSFLPCKRVHGLDATAVDRKSLHVSCSLVADARYFVAGMLLLLPCHALVALRHKLSNMLS